MSGATQSPLTPFGSVRASLVAVVSFAHQFLTSTVRTAAFWTAAALPLAYVPFVVGIGADVTSTSFAGLVALHALCLALGHEYTPSASA